MAKPEFMNHPSGLHETQVSGEEAGNGGSMEKLESYLKLAEECMEAVQKMSSRKFNNEQCGYLADKLKVVVQSASSFLNVLRAENHGTCSFGNIAKRVEIFKLLLGLAKQTESFIQGCCKDAWIQAAMTLTNVSEYISSLGFNLELCRVAFCKECTTTASLTSDQVDDINKAEVERVKVKASVDVVTLLEKVLLEQNSLLGEDRDLATYLLQRLLRVQPNLASFSLRSSSWSINDDGSFLGEFFKWVQQAERLGKGASATVHKAKWLGTLVAKKTFEGRDNPDFLKEVEILSRLCHPNITSMFCFAKNKRRCSIIMELMDEDLYTLMQRRCENSDSPPFPILEAVDIMLQISEGVNYLHTKGIVHRDLKSSNILIKSVRAIGSEIEYVQAKVADFGLSKTKQRSITYSDMTYNMGTNRWMAPEIINMAIESQGSSSQSDELPKYPFKCDTYSFAMVCYEILTGDVPFEDEGSLKIVKEKVLKGKRPNLPHDCPPLLKAFIKKCWNQEPKERPTFEDICLVLKNLKYLLMTGETILEGVEPRLDQTQSLRLGPSTEYSIQLPKVIDNLTTLKTLRMDADYLKWLPDERDNLTALTTLRIDGSTGLEQLPKDVGNMKTLTTLILDGCSSLKELHESVGNLTALITLSLDGCSSLKELHESVGNLTALTTLSLDGCSSLKELHESVGNLTALTTLSLDGCSSLRHIPPVIGNLTTLTTLKLLGCSNLKELPQTIGNLTALTTLRLGGCSNLKELPQTVGNLMALMTLRFGGCINLKELPQTIGNLMALTTLSMRCCSNLEELPHTLGNLTALMTLRLGGCPLKNLPQTIGNLKALTTLKVDGCSNLEKLPQIVGNLTALITLDLSSCSNLKELAHTVGNLTALTTLRLRNCSNLKELPQTIGNLTALMTLRLDGCSNLKELPQTLGNLTALTTLTLNGCSNLNQIPPEVQNLAALTATWRP